MNCFPCCSSQRSKKSASKRENASESKNLQEPGLGNTYITAETKIPKATAETKGESNQVENGNIAAQTFTFRELATATKNFRQECLLGEGGFGRVFKGKLQQSDQVVAVKQLDRNGMQGNKEFLDEVLKLSLLHHQNLVNLIGYCADGDQRLLVYEYMAGGSVEDHLLDITPEQKPLDWITRMKIAYGAAQGLEYLHDKANPPVIYQDLKSSNILLDEEFNSKLSDFGLAKLVPVGDKTPVSSRVMGTYGYCAPEYGRSGNLTVKSDVYSFGVFLLELITGRRAVDTTKPVEEQNLVAWAQPIFRDPKRFPDMADPLLNKQFPERGLNQVVAITAMCLQEEPAARPLISDVVTALSFLSINNGENQDSWNKSGSNNGDDDSTTDHEEDSATNLEEGSASLCHKDSRGSSDGIVSSSDESNRGSSYGGTSLKHNSSINSFLSTSSRKLQDGDISSGQDSSSDSGDQSFSLRQEHKEPTN